jgi:hypothetical protein
MYAIHTAKFQFIYKSYGMPFELIKFILSVGVEDITCITFSDDLCKQCILYKIENFVTTVLSRVGVMGD